MYALCGQSRSATWSVGHGADLAGLGVVAPSRSPTYPIACDPTTPTSRSRRRPSTRPSVRSRVANCAAGSLPACVTAAVRASRASAGLIDAGRFPRCSARTCARMRSMTTACLATGRAISSRALAKSLRWAGGYGVNSNIPTFQLNSDFGKPLRLEFAGALYHVIIEPGDPLTASQPYRFVTRSRRS